MTSKALQQLGVDFQVTDLGQGDTNLGFNILTTMACVLADLAPTDGTALTKEGDPARLGVNLLVTGSASSTVVGDEVLTEVGSRQQNLCLHLQRHAERIEELRRKPGATLPPVRTTSNGAEDSFAAIHNETGPLFSTRAKEFSRILREAPAEELPQLIRRTKFLVCAVRPNDLENQLQHLRSGHPLVHVGCTQVKDLMELAQPGAALIEGRYPLENSCEMVRANLLITDPLQMLHKAVKDGDERTAWLGHFLWLCDGGTGPNATAFPGKAADRPSTTAERFRRSLDSVIARRTSLLKNKPLKLALNTRTAKIRLRAFLTEMELRLPGISGAANRLVDSLAFGLEQMAGIERRISFSIEGVEALIRFLVLRMVNARTMILHAGALARRQSQIARVFRKLSQGPTDYRTIYRNLSLTAEDCEGCLQWMSTAGIIRNLEEEGMWQLEENARLNFDDCSTALLEV